MEEKLPLRKGHWRTRRRNLSGSFALTRSRPRLLVARLSVEFRPADQTVDGRDMLTLADIQAARRVIDGHVLRTPMLPAPKLSGLTGAQVWVKYENLQVTNSFKERGALNKLTSLSPDERKLGV